MAFKAAAFAAALLNTVLLGAADVVVLPTVAYPFDRQTLQRADIEMCASRLVRMAGYGRLPYERAAFLIVRDDGVFDCNIWPATFEARSETWIGRIPQGTAAIIHTHPLESPRPSSHDIREAARIGVPIIVATPAELAMAQPRGDVITVGMTRGWVIVSTTDEATAGRATDSRQARSFSH